MYAEGDLLAVIPNEGWEPKQRLTVAVLRIVTDSKAGEAYVVTEVSRRDGEIVGSGRFFGLTMRCAFPEGRCLMNFHILQAPTDVPNPEWAHGFVEVERILAEHVPEATNE